MKGRSVREMGSRVRRGCLLHVCPTGEPRSPFIPSEMPEVPLPAWPLRYSRAMAGVFHQPPYNRLALGQIFLADKRKPCTNSIEAGFPHRREVAGGL